MIKRIGLHSLFVLLLIGCSTEAPVISVAVEATLPPTEVAVTETSPPSPTPTEAMSTPTNTPLPPTSTPEPTITPSPTELPPEPTATLEPTATTEPSPMPEPTVPPLPGAEVLTFVPGEVGWFTVDDDVMGGVSSSTVSFAESSTMFFSGTMSLENNGGFSSVRSDWSPTDLSWADGVMVRVLGDGKVYRLRIRTAETGREISYNAFFETTPEAWAVAYIPFAEMVPTYRGFVMDVGALDAANIGSFGFMLSDKQPGEFALQVDWIRAVREGDLQDWRSEMQQ